MGSQKPALWGGGANKAEEESQSGEGLLCTPEVPANSKKTWSRSEGWLGRISDQILRFLS